MPAKNAGRPFWRHPRRPIAIKNSAPSDVDPWEGFAVSTLPYRGLMACSLTHCEQIGNIARKTIQKFPEPSHFADPEAKDICAECSL